LPDKRLLLVEDEPGLQLALSDRLSSEGYAVETAGDGNTAITRATGEPFDVIVLDVMLPGIDGFATCRELRRREIWTPVLMLTARDAVEDRVDGLDTGADDYLVKPFAFSELVARLRALARRAPVERPSVLSVGDLRLDPAARRAWRGDVELELSPKGFALLELFMRRPGVTLSREHLLQLGWDIAFERRSNVVDVYIRAVRAKIDKPFSRASIETVRGVGYRLRDDGG
jgi:two-component system OmpR family response regulator